jgi:hypothetical protein
MGRARPDVCEKVAKGEEEGGEDVMEVIELRVEPTSKFKSFWTTGNWSNAEGVARPCGCYVVNERTFTQCYAHHLKAQRHGRRLFRNRGNY